MRHLALARSSLAISLLQGDVDWAREDPGLHPASQPAPVLESEASGAGVVTGTLYYSYCVKGMEMIPMM